MDSAATANACPLLVGVCIGSEYAFPETMMALMEKISREGRDLLPGKRAIVAEYVREVPFSMHSTVRYDVVLDRISHQRPFLGEWLKKVILDGAYVINNPHHFQSKKKSYGYAAGVRLGFDIPRTYLLPPKSSYVDWRNMEPAFDVVSTGSEVGYPMYMKPYDGGGWRNVTRIYEPPGLRESYAVSGGQVMTIQEEVNFDYFIRCICIGSSVLPLSYDPNAYHHERYPGERRVPDHILKECGRTARIITAFLGFEMNSVEILVQVSKETSEGGSGNPPRETEKIEKMYLIDFNNPVPDMSLVSLHRFFPTVVWEMTRRLLFVGITRRRFRHESGVDRYIDLARSAASHEEKMTGYERLAAEFWGRQEYLEFTDNHCRDDYVKLETGLFKGPEFEVIMKKEIYDTFHDHSDPDKYQRFIERYNGLLAMSEAGDAAFMR